MRTPRQVWDANVPGRGGFLGEARLIKRDLVDGVPVDGVHEFTVALGPRRSASDTFNQIGQGFLRLKCQVSMFDTACFIFEWSTSGLKRTVVWIRFSK